MPVFRAFRVLASVELDNQAPLTTDKVDVVAIDRLLSSKFEAAGRRPRRRVHSSLPRAARSADPWVNSAGVSAVRSDRARSARFSFLPRNAVIHLPKRL